MRGEVWTVCASKPRPAVIIQSDNIVGYESTVVCLFTTDASMPSETRVAVRATEENGLMKDCFLMAKKPMAIRKTALGEKLGRLDKETMEALDTALCKVLGIKP